MSKDAVRQNYVEYLRELADKVAEGCASVTRIDVEADSSEVIRDGVSRTVYSGKMEGVIYFRFNSGASE